MSASPQYRLVQLKNGVHSVHSIAHAETFHPVVGPVAEAEALYVRQLDLPARLRKHQGEFVIWDVGLGAAANVLTVLRAISGIEATVRVVSFDHTLEPLEFALRHQEALGYFAGYAEAASELLRAGLVLFDQPSQAIKWELHRGDFPTLIASPSEHPFPAPHAILFDAFSPAKNPAMWTLPLFTQIFRRLDPARPCALPTYSRSTLLRVSLLLAGFFVGAGHATGEKEETTIAANTIELIDDPLDGRWLARVRRSNSAEPLHRPIYRQAPLSDDSWEKLQEHPQFRRG